MTTEGPAAGGAEGASPAQRVARRAWEAWKHDVETGDPEPIVAMMTDDYSLCSLTPPSAPAASSTARTSTGDLPLAVERPGDAGGARPGDRITGSGDTWAFERSIVSENRGHPYTNRTCIFFDVRGEKVSAHREYVDELDPRATANGAVEPTDAPPRRGPS